MICCLFSFSFALLCHWGFGLLVRQKKGNGGITLAYKTSENPSAQTINQLIEKIIGRFVDNENNH